MAVYLRGFHTNRYCGVHNYEGLFCPWQLGLDIHQHPKTLPVRIIINRAILSWFVHYMRYG